MQKLAGEVDGLNLIWENDGENTSLSGKGSIQLAAEALPGGEPLPVELAGSIEADGREVKLEDLALTVDGNTAQINCDVDFNDLERIQGKGEIKAGKTCFEGARIYQSEFALYHCGQPHNA